MARIRIPPSDVPAVDPKTGLWTSDWYDTIKSLERLGLLDLFDTTSSTPAAGQIMAYDPTSGKFILQPIAAPSNGQVLIWNSTTKLWTPGAN